MLFLVTSFSIILLKTTKIAMTWNIWRLLCIWLSAFSSSSDPFLRLPTRNLSTENSSKFSEVIHLIKVILIAPVTNAILERSFST